MQDVQVSVEAENGLERKLRVQVPAARIEQEIEGRLRSVARNATLKGYRKGKVPAKVIRKQYSAQVRREVLQELLQSSYSHAVSLQKLRPAGDVQIDTENPAEEAGADLTYTASFEVFPEFELQGLDALTADKPEPAFDDADLAFVIDNLRRQRAHFHVVDRESRDGDQVEIDFDGALDGKPIDGGNGEKVPVVVGSGRLIPDFERQLTGRKAGEKFEISVKFPDDYGAAELAGREAIFKVTVHAVSAEHVPEADAEFIRGFGVESGEVADFHGELRKNMTQEFEARAQAELKQQLLEKLLAANPIDVPRSLVEQEAGNLRSDAMRNMGLTDESKAPAAETFRPSAERRVRLGLLIGAIIREQSLVADRARVTQRIEQLASGYEKPDEIRKIYLQNAQLMGQVEHAVLEEQVVEWLATTASVTPRPSSFKDIVSK